MWRRRLRGQSREAPTSPKRVTPTRERQSPPKRVPNPALQAQTWRCRLAGDIFPSSVFHSCVVTERLSTVRAVADVEPNNIPGATEVLARAGSWASGVAVRRERNPSWSVHNSLVGDKPPSGVELVVAQPLGDDVDFIEVDGRHPLRLVGELVVDPGPHEARLGRALQFE